MPALPPAVAEVIGRYRRLPIAVRLRVRAVGGIAAIAIAWRAGAPSPPARTRDGVASILGEAIAGTVRPNDFVWEKPEGIAFEAVWGRRVLFLASEDGGPRDLWRARVRLAIDGQPLTVTEAINLTQTPLADEGDLTADGPFAKRWAVLGTSAYGAMSTAMLFDLDGDGGVVGEKGVVDRWLGAITNLQETHASEGIGRTELAFEHPPKSARFGLDGKRLAVQLGDAVGTYDLDKHTLDKVAEDAGVTAQTIPHLRKNVVLWAVDTVRSVVGPGPIAWLEDRFFGMRDSVRQASHATEPKRQVKKEDAGEEAPPPSPPLDASAAGDDGGYWPPAKLPSIWQQPEAGEGEWVAVRYPFLHKLPGAIGDVAPPPYFQQTWIAPDKERPYSKVLVVAMDMRQLELGMEGGVEDPKPLTGARGFGRIPRDPAVWSRVVGAFNGAFKTTHGAYGMMVQKRVLLPAKVDAATVLTTDDGRVGIGTWRRSEDLLSGIDSFRQNLDVLVEDGKLNPSGRQQWGFQLAGTSVLTERTGVCVTKPGHFFYFWGEDVSGLTLGKAMVQAGCVVGMHLDMNPKHTGFTFAGIRDIAHKDYDVKLLTPQMEILPERYVEWSPKDFFYVMVRPAPAVGAIGFQPDKGAQPAPAWLPGVWHTDIAHEGVTVSLLGIDDGRALFRVRGGSGEEGAAPTDTKGLDDTEAHKVLAAFGLGAARSPRPMGLTIAGKVIAPFRGRNGYLAIDASGGVHVSTGEPPATLGAVDVTEAPLVVAAAHVLAAAEERGPTRRRSAACVLPTGRAVFAFSTSDTDQANAIALQKAGCVTAVALDRGAHSDAFFQRAGLADEGTPRTDRPVLYAVATPLAPRAFAWNGVSVP